MQAIQLRADREVHGGSRGRSGHTVAELATALALTGIAAVTVVSSAAALRGGVALLNGRRQVASIFEHARREAYRLARTVEAHPHTDGRAFVVRMAGRPDRNFSIASGRIVAMPARGYVSFYASGLADNATFTLEETGGGRADIIVNQRGEIRWR